MAWTRSPLMRAIALAASVALVLVNWEDRGAWFWVGVALVVLNVAGFLASRSGSDGDGPDEPQSHRLGDLLFLPGVSEAFAEGPSAWRQVSYLDDEEFEPTPVEEIASYVWLEYDDSWSIGLDDEVKPYLDLDIDEADDPMVRVLQAHPAVEDAFHEDREVYRVEQRHPISKEEFAALAARALVAHHVSVSRG